jgi:hypothetical protein
MNRPSSSSRSLAGLLARSGKKGMGYAIRAGERMIRYARVSDTTAAWCMQT